MSSIGKKFFWIIGVPALIVALGGVGFFWKWGEAMVERAVREDASAICEQARSLGEQVCAGCQDEAGSGAASASRAAAGESILLRQVRHLFQRVLWAVLIFAAALWLAVALALHAFLARPLQRLAAAMHRAEEGDFVARAEVKGNDEISRLAGAFNRMLARLTSMKVSEIDTHRDLAMAKEQLALKRVLEGTNADLRDRVRELSLLYDLARAFTSTLELPALLERISRLIAQHLLVPWFSLMLLREDGRLEVKSAFPPDQGTEGLTFEVGEGACGRAAQSLEPVYLSDVENDEIFVRRGHGPERGSLLSVPMTHDGTLLGVLNFQRPELAAFGPSEIALFTAVADQAALAVKNARLHGETVALSVTDPLTGAPNRRYLFSRLEMEIALSRRFGSPVSVLMIDIDHFKQLNDAVGHRAGDSVLRQTYELMEGMTRKVDTLARYGGEEFMLVLPQTARQEAAEVAEKLRRAVEQNPFPEGRTQPGGRVTISVGLASFPADATELDLLVDCADAALYASKRGGRNRVTAFEPGMEQHPGRERGLGRPRKQEAG